MTTILSVRKKNNVVIGGDGQATFGDYIIKPNVKKVRKIYNNSIIVGFSGSTSDSITLLELFEQKLNENNGNLLKSSVDLSKNWRNDKFLKTLETLLVVVDIDKSFLISGNGDVMQLNNDLIAIGSGGMYAKSAACALLENTELSAKDIVNKSLCIASDICIYTNKNFIIEELKY
ncbi:ATP-dependent protease subunit HslV [endosymbiont of Pachyrhynchus infernalis]|uniref:ATP-dependent protease subunit HslV n=1 Tax=endosymbiont of Pachyrhynchus infernalis TaxID=1971488 RepID=UPI000DC71BFD|nr:ATP-dependent protease subunit HslV [endosymbiont of Pachyrhynchus infernalis]BBA84944.1 ATP-dependent protease subunit HslV [endosymbiont of Pachyrhynchus infernalis]